MLPIGQPSYDIFATLTEDDTVKSPPGLLTTWKSPFITPETFGAYGTTDSTLARSKRVRPTVMS